MHKVLSFVHVEKRSTHKRQRFVRGAFLSNTRTDFKTYGTPENEILRSAQNDDVTYDTAEFLSC